MILGPWTIWNHRNSCVFDGAASSLAGALGFVLEERRLFLLKWSGVVCVVRGSLPPFSSS